MIWTFIFGVLVGTALTAIVIWFISDCEMERYYNRHERGNRK